MKNTLRFIISAFALCVTFASCEDEVKVIELQRIEVDTTYYYKVQITEDGESFYDVVREYHRYQPGDTIRAIR